MPEGSARLAIALTIFWHFFTIIEASAPASIQKTLNDDQKVPIVQLHGWPL